MNLPEQIREIELILDFLHDECAAAFGDDHEVTISALKGSARAFALYCDFVNMYRASKDD